MSPKSYPSLSLGPLRLNPANPRYFMDPTGKAVYLAGSHVWHNLQDNGHRQPETNDIPPVFNYQAYLDFLQLHNHNFFRLWRWELPKWVDGDPPGVKFSQPHPWMREGPGLANDGKLKFDLTRFNLDYFNRLRERVQSARHRGIYVSIMLFEGWAVQLLDVWRYHPFNGHNNINGLEADSGNDGRGLEFYTLEKTPVGKRILTLQQAYIRNVVDSVNDLDNVLYEICNEAGVYSTEWQYTLIRYIKDYEARKPWQHPVGMTFQYKGGSNQTLFDSPADWVSPNPGGPGEDYIEDPSPEYRGKVIMNDADHLWGHTRGDSTWVWKSFCRGLNVLFMETLDPSPTWQDSARQAMRQTRAFSNRVDLDSLLPHGELTSTTYCLARPGDEYLIFQPCEGSFTLDLQDTPAQFNAEWSDAAAGDPITSEGVTGGEICTFVSPFKAPLVLHLKLKKV
jgi:hypothetical protein